MAEKQYAIPVNKEAYERFSELLKKSREDHPANRLQRKDLGSFAIKQLTEENVVNLARSKQSLKVIVKSYFANNRNNDSPEELLELLRRQIPQKV